MLRLQAVVLFVMLSLIIPLNAFGQEIKFGLKGGVNSSWIIDDDTGIESVRGVNIAGFAEVQFSGRISMLLDLGLNQRGFERVQTETSEDGTALRTVSARTRLDYLTITPQLNVHFSKTHWRPYVGIGSRFDFLVDRRIGEFEFSSGTVPDETAEFMEDFVIGSVLSAGIKHGSQNAFQWKLELRYDRDFTDSIPDFPGLFRSNSVALLFGISF
ncbi:MAG: PorT family protein [Balneolaceae bacterium]|nr:PorT family protein [Balneolaceae bacterium]